MAKIKFSRDEFEKKVKITKEIEEKISMFGTPFEGMNGDEVEIEVFPNRPDMLSLYGYLRAFEAFLGKKGKTGMTEYKISKSNYKMTVDKNIPGEWPFALACVVKGLKLDDAKIKDIIQLQEKLTGTMLRDRRKGGLGVYPLNKLKFPIKFEGRKSEEIIFRPLEMNDYITAGKILSLHPTGRRYADICEGWERFPVFVDANDVIMSMPPIINSHDVGRVGLATKDLFIEATGTDKDILQKALNILATSLAEMGGTIYSVECIQKDGSKSMQPNLENANMKLGKDSVEEVLGIKLSEKEISEYLGRMGLDYDSKTRNVAVPAWRCDIIHEYDLVEDIAIAHGYDKFDAAIPTDDSSTGNESRKSKFSRKIAEILSGIGALEVSTYYLHRKSDVENVLGRSPFEVKESKTDYKFLRGNLSTNILRIMSENVDSEYPQAIFEVGDVFVKDKKKSDTGVGEKRKIGFAVSPGNFTEVKQVLDYLMRMLGISYNLEAHKRKILINGRTARILVRGKPCGFIGEVHPGILKNLRMKTSVGLFEINVKDLFLALK